MDGFKKRLGESVQLRLSVALSLAILTVAIVAGVFAYVSAFDEAHDMQDDTLRQMAKLFDRQHMTLQYPENGAADDDEARIVLQYLADGSKASGDDDAGTPLPFPTTLPDGLSTVPIAGEAFRVLVKTTAQGERIAVAQETGARDKDARASAWRSVLPFLVLLPILLLVVSDLVRELFRPLPCFRPKSTAATSRNCIRSTNTTCPSKSAPSWWRSIDCSTVSRSPWKASAASSPTPPTNCARR